MSPGTKINQNNNNYDDSNEHRNQDLAQGYMLPLIPNTTESDVLNFHTLIGTVLSQTTYLSIFGLVGCPQIEIVELRSSRALSREELSKGQFLLVAINPPAIINSHWTRSYLHKCRQAYHHHHRHNHCYS